MRCESPSTFLGTCLSHHSFIIFLVTNTNTLLSDLYLISTYNNCEKYQYHNPVCQCPLGLIPHFYENIIRDPESAASSCQCPLGLIPHFYEIERCKRRQYIFSVNALSGLYLISTVPLQKPRFYAISRTCFCRYLSEYSDNSRFSCMLTFGTYLMRCTYP